MRLSLVIPAKTKDDPKLVDLLRSIDNQDLGFPRSELEVLVVTEGTSESAKAIGIKKAQGEVICFLASDNELVDKNFLMDHYGWAQISGASYPANYHYFKHDDPLNRYFTLLGGNDPLAFYMEKNDRRCYLDADLISASNKTTGDNGFFINRGMILETDLDNYYHIDNSQEALRGYCFMTNSGTIWHRTGGNIFKFFQKRYRYGLEHAFNKNRRWHLVDFRKPQDIWRLLWFVIAAITIIEPITLSIRGWLKIRDKAWFLHPVVCLLTLFTYTILICHLGLRKLSQSLFVPLIGRRA